MKNNTHCLRFLGAVLTAGLLFLTGSITAQENRPLPDKVHHAEPLYNDLVRDLGARKGEKEFNVGADIKKMNAADEYGYLMEYEFAPIDRLGLEVETDFAYTKSKLSGVGSSNELERLRLSSQYSFYVSKQHATTMAVGYTQIFNFVEGGTAFNPFFVAAKSWQHNWHTLIYTGPEIAYRYKTSKVEMNWQINTSFHYTLPETDHFIGVEVNQVVADGKLETTLRPQVKLGVNDKLAIGMAAGFPVGGKDRALSSFFRLIYQL